VGRYTSERENREGLNAGGIEGGNGKGGAACGGKVRTGSSQIRVALKGSASGGCRTGKNATGGLKEKRA